MCNIDQLEESKNAKTMEDRIGQIIGNTSQTNRFMLLARVEISQNSRIQACSSSSILTCLIKAAELGLFIGGGEAFLVPYKQTCSLQVGYQGMLKLMYRAGVKYVKADIVYANDEFKYRSGTKSVLSHSKTFGERGDIVCAYAIARIGKEDIIEVMRKDELNNVQKLSKTGDLWKANYDEMAKKSVIKRLFKRLPHENFNPQLMAETENILISDRTTEIDEHNQIEQETVAPAIAKYALGSDAVSQIL